MKRQNPTEQADNLQNKGFGPCKLRVYLLFTGVCTARRVGVKPCFLEANTVHCGGSESLDTGEIPNELNLVMPACAHLCCKNMCCASRFCTGGGGGCRQQIKATSKGLQRKMLAQGNNLKL